MDTHQNFTFYNTQPNHQHQIIPLSNPPIRLRFIQPTDYNVIKYLCNNWFPVEYPEKWFENIIIGDHGDGRLYSVVAVVDGDGRLCDEIVGLIICELKAALELSKDDEDILCSQHKKYTIAYILSLGVCNQYRRTGIATLLLNSLLNHLSTIANCKAVYLHVLTSNEAAIRFYEKNLFRVHKFLPYYYSISGHSKDGFTYVRYINNGHGQLEFNDYVHSFINLMICLPGWFVRKLRKIVQIFY